MMIMPGEILFDMPLSARINADSNGQLKEHLEWLKEQQLLNNDQQLHRYLYSRVQDLTPYCFPEATGDDLKLGRDFVGWFFFFDDQFVDMSHPHPAWAACENVIDWVSQSSNSSMLRKAPPIAGSLADLWDRILVGMSTSFRRRAAYNLTGYLWGTMARSVDQFHGIIPTPEACLWPRRKTIGVRPILDAAERIGHFEIPLDVWNISRLNSLRIYATDHVALTNEIYSLEKDERLGQPNLITSMIQHSCLTRTESIHQVKSMADAVMSNFMRTETAVIHLRETLGLDETAHQIICRYSQILRCVIRGTFDWHRLASAEGRYSIDNPDHPGQLSHDLVTPAAPESVSAISATKPSCTP